MIPKNIHRHSDDVMRAGRDSFMRRMQRIVLWGMLVAAVPVIAGCADFDPDKLDVFGLNEKKKLPGERKALFPEGVPGVNQGIPPEYIKGSQPAAEAALPVEPVEAQAAPAPVEPPKPKRTVVRRTPKPAATTAAPVEPVTSQPAAAAQPAKPAQQGQSTSAWPAPTQNSPPSSAWPAPQPSGTFTR